MMGLDPNSLPPGFLRAIHREPVYANRNRSLPPCSKPQSPVRDEPVAAEGGEGKDTAGIPGRVGVTVTSYRRRLIDPDNLAPKYFVDCLRYAGLIKDDSAKDIEYSVRQEKVETKEEERTVIEIFTIHPESGDDAET